MASKAGRTAGLIGAAVGVLAAGAAAGVAVERQVIGRRSSQRAQLEAEPFGSLRGTPHVFTADDGVELYVEVDALKRSRRQEPQRRKLRNQDAMPEDLTLIFAHGYGLNMDCWHFERRDLAGIGTMVFYDQRSHGRSGRSPKENVSIDQLGRDLYGILQKFAPSGPVVLIGHSMGGMSIMALAEQHPELFGDRVIGVGLCSTSAGGLDRVPIALPGRIGMMVRTLATPTVAALARIPDVVERSRKAGTDISYLLTRKYSFGSEVPPAFTEFVNEMIAATPISVIAEFYPIFSLHDKTGALEPLQKVECVVIGGDNDHLTPFAHSEQIVRHVPGAELVEVKNCGHLGLIEHHREFTAALLGMIERAEQSLGHR
ncbi:alpha/beta hydrolase fold protein [Kribbella flavida DSM 17836]|uniref:Alpha/beta hydrolase fold protein n=1 Tax=Kribbella flavida (strain DSM 17836 / JCM 10339 / NBRC 14399) TaxID=479435 RepID=D2PSZ1_KRIFD|nr:alpha/beta hydrolase [Kribbella flavida]ADB35043.1 alpha/beta hydrolase fold protein [Kribbella flavida DSM 17836]